MVPHYTLAKHVYCSGSDLVGHEFGVALVEQTVTVVVGQVVEQKVKVVVGQVVEAEEWEESYIGASTLDEMHSTEFAAKHRIEMNGWLVGHDIEM